MRDDTKQGITVADFCAHLPDRTYIFMLTGAFWSAAGVNSCLKKIPKLDAAGNPTFNKKGEQIFVPATALIDKNQPVHDVSWAPGYPQLIRDQVIIDGGWVKRKGLCTFNFYRPPIIKHGDRRKVRRWLKLLIKVFPDDYRHIIAFLAHRVQRPSEKINHGLLLGGIPGIGKDSIIEPAKRAVGPWNCKEASAQQMLERFNPFLQSVILRVSEARDLGEFSRYAFHEHMKTYLASPPDTLCIDEKFIPLHWILNCTGVIITTNHLTDGIFLPADDRRHYVAWSTCEPKDFPAGYWTKLYAWYDNGGAENVAAYLATFDLNKCKFGKFDPKAPPPKTSAFWQIVDANRAPEDAELTDILEKLENPQAVTLRNVIDKAGEGYEHLGFQKWLVDQKNYRTIPHRFEQCGYTRVRNDSNAKGLWVVGGTRKVVYALNTLTLAQQIKAVHDLQEKEAEKSKPKLDVRTP